MGECTRIERAQLFDRFDLVVRPGPRHESRNVEQGRVPFELLQLGQGRVRGLGVSGCDALGMRACEGVGRAGDGVAAVFLDGEGVAVFFAVCDLVLLSEAVIWVRAGFLAGGYDGRFVVPQAIETTDCHDGRQKGDAK